MKVAPSLSHGVRNTELSYAMYGTCGDWVYVLEDWGMATWYSRSSVDP